MAITDSPHEESQAAGSREPWRSRLRRRAFWQRALRLLAAVYFTGAGLLHFITPGTFRPLVPPALPRPDLLVEASGVLLIVFALGLLVPRWRRPAGIALIALLLAMLPANIYHAIAQVEFGGRQIPTWLLWLRLPLQNLYILWIWFAAVYRPRPEVR